MSDTANARTQVTPAAPESLPTRAANAVEGTSAQQTAPFSGAATVLPSVPGYTVVREIARGGMGTVYLAHDPTFGREVAVKVMHLGQNAERFVVESRVTAQLPHPGVPPVHALGALADGRPFLAMKLVEGHTLTTELKSADRSRAGGLYPADLPRLLGTFESICLTVGFAHAKGIIHRDLKPSNVMVGSFGEVLVMDWGLAKEARNEDRDSVAGGFRSRAPGFDETVVGAVKGTPAYMAPEQARGEPVDVRADVFALGGILAAALTGKPPFAGDTVRDTVLRAAQAELHECFAQLDACPADDELVAIAKRRLSARPSDRYADGAAVAAAVAAYRAGVEERLREAERDRAAAEARAAEQRKRRKVQLALAAVVALFLATGGAALWYSDHRAAARALADERANADRKATEARLAGERDAEARNKAAQARQAVRANLALATGLRKQYKFEPAAEALAQAGALARGGAPDLLGEVERARTDLAFVVLLDDIRYRKWVWVVKEGSEGNFNTKIAPPEYRKAFADRGLDLTALAPTEAAKRIAAAPVKAELVAAVDDWALHEPDPALRDRLLEVARRADPGPWTDRLRDPAVRADKTAVEKLAADADPGREQPAALSALAWLMMKHRLDTGPLLSAARARHPTDFELAFVHGQRTATGHGGRETGPYEAARALRPENAVVWNNLGAALFDAGDLDGAAANYRGAIERDPRLVNAHNNLGTVLAQQGDAAGTLAAAERALARDPTNAKAHYLMGNALKDKGDFAGAAAAYRAAVRHDPAYARAHTNLGNALRVLGDTVGARAAYREALRHEPGHAATHSNLGTVLFEAGDVAGAISAYREAIRLDPKDRNAHFNLALALEAKGDTAGALAAYRTAVENDPTSAKTHNNLGTALKASGDVAGALAAYRAAIKHDPRYAPAHKNLGIVLHDKGDFAGALTAYREAARLDPKLDGIHSSIGIVLAARGDPDGALAAYKVALRYNPKDAVAHNNLGSMYLDQKRYPEAIASARAAIAADPKVASAHAMLGFALQQTGDIAGARAALTEAARLDKRWAPLLAKLPARPVAPPPREVNR